MSTNETTIEDMLKVVDAWNELDRRIMDLKLSILILSPNEVKARLQDLNDLIENNRGNKNSLAGHIGQQKRQMNPK